MIAVCKTNDAFEDNLSTGKAYPLIQLKNQSIQVLNDRGQICWYGVDRFRLLPSQSPLPSKLTKCANQLY